MNVHDERKSVAVIGAGISGLMSARYLHLTGLNVTVFERSGSLGGVWVYDSRPAPEPTYPSVLPSAAEIIPDTNVTAAADSIELDEHGLDAIELRHAPPGPAYVNLRNNIPTHLMRLRFHPWKQDTPEYVGHASVLEYIQDFAQAHELQKLISFNSRVESVVKRGSKWEVRVWTLNKNHNGKTTYLAKERLFDSVVVAIGHYSAPKIPQIPGLAEWKRIWPTRVIHAKSYKNPERYKDQNILLIGAGVSSTDIASDLSSYAKKIYQVARGGKSDIPARFLPDNAERIPEIVSFAELGESTNTEDNDLSPLTRPITLVNGQELKDIHTIIICTGYLISYPFFKHLHSDETRPEAADGNVLVTDGSMVHNLHRDVFYIPDPSLAFVGTAYSVTSFAFSEYQAIAIAAVFSGRVKMPLEQEMRAEYDARILNKGHGRQFHTLKEDELNYVSELLTWLNQGQLVQPIEGYSEQWLLQYQERREWLKSVFISRAPVQISVE